MKPLLIAISAIAVLSAGGCVTTTSVKKTDVHSAFDEADTAYSRLPSELDPDGRALASRRLVVIGHSMGDVISHTLASSSEDKVWSSAFRVPADQLKGDPAAIANLQHILIFKREPRIGRIIFVAAPHRGSPMADSLIVRSGHNVINNPEAIAEVIRILHEDQTTARQ